MASTYQIRGCNTSDSSRFMCSDTSLSRSTESQSMVSSKMPSAKSRMATFIADPSRIPRRAPPIARGLSESRSRRRRRAARIIPPRARGVLMRVLIPHRRIDPLPEIGPQQSDLAKRERFAGEIALHSGREDAARFVPPVTGRPQVASSRAIAPPPHPFSGIHSRQTTRAEYQTVSVVTGWSSRDL